MAIQLPFGIEVVTQDGTGSITSDLHEEGYLWDIDDSQEDKDRAAGAADAIESFLLALACAGVNIQTMPFAEALDTMVNAFADQ